MKEIRIEEFIVSGPHVRTSNALEFSASGKVSGLWQEFYTANPGLEGPVYGVYSSYESDASGEFTVTAGTRVNAATGSGVSIKSGNYLTFPAEGMMPAAIIDAWKFVWEHFSTKHSYERSYVTDFEEYSGPTTAIIYIGITSSTNSA